ncbi:RUS family member 1 [Plutella xylostella]|uniref:RUS family member 1 n=1 Tax=Plutella xylostella TaxID=51655 RepID=UPI002033114C|nr:RUS family member 1 [Plutella xylostella]
MSRSILVCKETYGGSSRERLYVIPPAQKNIVSVVLVDNKRATIINWFTKVFLPQGYPKSVSDDYLSYQIWDTAQAFCSTITGTLATQEVLRGVGVGSTEATPLAATITWVVKDSCGHLGKILFAFSHGTHLDAYSKTWRLYADTLNDAAMCVEIALPLFKNMTTFLLCLSTVMKAIVGVAGGATRAALTQHHAVRSNLGDVAAKDAAQETAVNLVASMAALLVISVFGNSLVIFSLLTVLHIVFNYLAVRSVCLRSLNEPRLLQLTDLYLRHGALATPEQVNRSEPLVFYQLGGSMLDLKLCGFQIKLGHSFNSVLKHYNASELQSILDVYEKRQYMVVPAVGSRRMFVFVTSQAKATDVLCGYLHAVMLAAVTCAINDVQLPILNMPSTRPFAELCLSMQGSECSRSPVPEAALTAHGLVYNPSLELMRDMDQVVQREWLTVYRGMKQTGWDVSTHLLVLDEWRMHRQNASEVKVATD